MSQQDSWLRHCSEICIQAYSRLSMITRLRYVGVHIDDLLDVYKLFIRSIIEYCSVVYHSRLTEEQSTKIERIQKTCLKVILREMYIDYQSALEMTGLDTLKSRRLKRCLNFSLKSIKHSNHQKMFPSSESNLDCLNSSQILSSLFWDLHLSHSSSLLKPFPVLFPPFCHTIL